MKICSVILFFSLAINVALIVRMMNGGEIRAIDLKPLSGETAYIMAVNEAGEPGFYSRNGRKWSVCGPNECTQIPSNLNIEFPYEKGFVLVEFNGRETSVTPRRQQASILDSLVPSAFAQASDGLCPVNAVEVKNKRIIKHYPSPEEDVDCPPK